MKIFFFFRLEKIESMCDLRIVTIGRLFKLKYVCMHWSTDDDDDDDDALLPLFCTCGNKFVRDDRTDDESDWQINFYYQENDDQLLAWTYYTLHMFRLSFPCT